MNTVEVVLEFLRVIWSGKSVKSFLVFLKFLKIPEFKLIQVEFRSCMAKRVPTPQKSKKFHGRTAMISAEWTTKAGKKLT